MPAFSDAKHLEKYANAAKSKEQKAHEKMIEAEEGLSVSEDVESEEQEMLCDGFEAMEAELREAAEKQDLSDDDNASVDSQDPDKAAYRIPQDDAGFLTILKERFGHDSFKSGQLDAIKILLHKKLSVLVVLATGGGKSLIYQFVSLFVPGLIIVVTPLISLMFD